MGDPVHGTLVHGPAGMLLAVETPYGVQYVDPADPAADTLTVLLAQGYTGESHREIGRRLNPPPRHPSEPMY